MRVVFSSTLSVILMLLFQPVLYMFVFLKISFRPKKIRKIIIPVQVSTVLPGEAALPAGKTVCSPGEPPC